MAHVIIAKAGDRPRAVIERLLDACLPDVNGRTVWVKPNMLGPFPPQRGVTTAPDILQAVVRALLDRGAIVTVGDNPSATRSDQSGVAGACGLLAASEGCFRNIGLDTREVRIGGRWERVKLPVSSIWLEADLIVNLSCLKTHNLTFLTGAVKNMFGGIPGGMKARLHTMAPSASSFAGLLARIYAIRPPDLNIMDARMVMEGNGPSAGRLRHCGVIIGGADGPAVDAVAAVIMGKRPAQVPLLLEAARLGLGEIDPDKLEIEGDIPVLGNFKAPANTLMLLANRFNPFAWLYVVVPLPLHDRCSRCGACADSCRSAAIAMTPYPVIDRRRCISCFCCSEICPERAFRIPGMLEGTLRRFLPVIGR